MPPRKKQPKAHERMDLTCPHCGSTSLVRRGAKIARCSKWSCAAVLKVGPHSVRVHGTDAAEVERVSKALLADVHAQKRPPTPWASGSFYLAAAIVLLASVLVATRVVPVLVLPPLIIAAVVLLAVIGGFQLRHDERLSDKSFLSLMALSFRALPWVRSDAAPYTKGEQATKNV
jgi:ribosomal protein L37AE/L43A